VSSWWTLLLRAFSSAIERRVKFDFSGEENEEVEGGEQAPIFRIVVD